MVDLNSNISAIALNMNGLSVPIKRQRLVREELKKQNSTIFYLQEKQLKIKR